MIHLINFERHLSSVQVTGNSGTTDSKETMLCGNSCCPWWRHRRDVHILLLACTMSCFVYFVLCLAMIHLMHWRQFQGAQSTEETVACNTMSWANSGTTGSLETLLCSVATHGVGGIAPSCRWDNVPGCTAFLYRELYGPSNQNSSQSWSLYFYRCETWTVLYVLDVLHLYFWIHILSFELCDSIMKFIPDDHIWILCI